MWDKLTSRGNVEDRRAMGPARIGGGIGIAGVAVLLLFNYLSGGEVNVNDVLTQLNNVQVQQQPIDTKAFNGADNYEVFASTVLGSANDMWANVFAANNAPYTPPKLVLFRGATQSACGGASSATGPHYCPTDETIYLDETFFSELTTRLGAEGGDVAEAYVIAHEVGHHVQHALDSLGDGRSSNTESVAIELQADCYAGLWAHSIKDQGVFAPGEIHEAIDAAAAVGDDRIQQATTGRVNPETWTHGSSEQRVAAFDRGYEQGTASACAIRTP